MLVAVKWSVNGSISKIVRLIVARSRSDCGVHVAIGASNNNVEVLAPLSRPSISIEHSVYRQISLPVIDSIASVDWSTPENALDVREGRRVGDVGGRVGRWITLEVYYV